MELKFCGPVQTSEALTGVTAAARKISGCAQDIVPPAALTKGGIVSIRTSAIVEAVHPLAAVAVKV